MDNVQLLNSVNKKKIAKGTLYLTATYLVFVDPDRAKEKWVSHNAFVTEFIHIIKL